MDNGDYNRVNSYWRSYSIIDEIRKLNDLEQSNFENKIKKIYQEYDKLSELYQENKNENLIPLNWSFSVYSFYIYKSGRYC